MSELEQQKISENPENELSGKKKKNKKVKEKKPLWQEILSWVLTLLCAFAAAMLIRSVIFEPVRVDGESMDDTLADKEIMLVSKYDYSSTWLCLPWQSDNAAQQAPRITLGNPNFLDVVICRYPARGAVNFVKRVVGMPGDTVELREGYLYVNGEKYEEPYILDEYRSGSRNNFGPYEVPEGEYFVMGDHRNNSNDSRSQGSLPRNMIIGHARTVLYPFSDIRGIE